MRHRPREIRLTTGYWDCRKRIARLRRFQNLIRHREKWGHQLDLAPPLATLIPELYREIPDEERSGYMPNLTPEQVRVMREPAIIEREINRLIPMVHAYLNVLGIDTRRTYSRWNHAEGREDKTEFDLISDYFYLPPEGTGSSFNAVIGVVEQGIGVYEARQHVAKLEILNPLLWFAWIIRSPLYVLERAGFDESPAAVQSAVFQGYAWIVRSLVVVLLVLLATKLGISIPWQQIWTALLK